jgi:carboxyl-terminal processing protease
MWRPRIQIAVLIIAWFAIGWLARGWLQPPLNSEMQLVAQAGNAISTQAYGPLPAARDMTYAAIRGMLDSLNDKYAVFFDPLAAAHDALGLQGDDAVIGLRGEMQANQFVVVAVQPSEPAAQAGLQNGDIITEIDGWTVKDDSSSSEVLSMVRGPIGSVAHLTLRRGNQTSVVDVPRRPAQNIITRTLTSGIGYIQLEHFTNQSPQQMDVALRQLLATQPPALIWDLRYNGGGLMNSTQQVLDLFLDEGMAFYAKTNSGQLIPYPTKSGDIAEKIPLVVLIGPQTYSAPETTAAAIADRGRGKLIGAATHGKGSIVTTIKLLDGSALRLTVARWLSPVHQHSFEGEGVPPDIAVPATDQGATEDAVLQRAVDWLVATQPQ